MCGRFSLSIIPTAFELAFGVFPPEGYAPRRNIAPDARIVALAWNGEGRRAIETRWGLIPPWSSDPADPSRQINARSETAAEKPMFRDAFRSNRLLVPADGFYEWGPHCGRKQAHLVRRKDGAPMAFAAIGRPRSDGGALSSCAILTTTARPSIASIHHRMPVMLAPERWDAWLDPTLDDPRAISALLEPLGDDAIEAFAVTNEVGDPRYDQPAAHEALPPEALEPAQGVLL